ncbi:MAG TPA: gephyrin-like molybdotransferase Glp [Solirubrobacteraceae bacterium]|jgi:molybdopterin molybdotransferase|nr:gephyrin-like molybdotransferase Glp [Solirubrobacteraceae bacterium]
MSASDELEIDDARRIVLKSVRPLDFVELSLDDALGRVLAGDVLADAPLPAFDSSAMDGWAVRAADVASASASEPVALRPIGESRAGHPASQALAEGETIAISTGAMIPAGADAVVRVERTRRHESGSVVEVLEAVPAANDIRRAGEDVAQGAVVLRAGATLGPAEIGMHASLGRARALCSRAPRVSVLATGDELVAPGETGRPGTVRDSNSHSIAALARRAGAHVVRRATLPDDAAVTMAAIAEGAADSDALLLCGGVSVGEHDHVRPSLQRLDASQRFWGLALKPGHPTWFGTLGDALVFGLPGNPVSAMVTFALLAAPALRAMQGARDPHLSLTAALDGGYRKRAGRAHAVRCTISARDDGWHARPTGPQGSHMLSSMLAADALAIVPGAVSELPDGARVRIEPLRALAGGRL